MRFILVIGLFLVGCASPIKFEKHLSVSVEFTPYIISFQEHAAQYGQNVRIDDLIVRFNDKLNGTETIGLCTTDRYETPIIDIQPDHWYNQNEYGRQVLMYHELGHCVLGLDHDDSFIYSSVSGRNVPNSIMYPNYFWVQSYFENHDHYLKQLFMEN